MRKLTRPMPGPASLARYDHNTHKWKGRVPTVACKNDIWQKLIDMQGEFCAFCERSGVFQGSCRFNC